MSFYGETNIEGAVVSDTYQEELERSGWFLGDSYQNEGK